MFSHHTRHNLLFIVTDQQRHDAVGYKNDLVQTPNINRLASQSVICEQAVVQSPQCQPSRASFLTGLYPDKLHMWWNEIKLNPKYATIGNYLSNNGYETAYFGKLHIDGDGNYKQIAKHYGFDITYLSQDWIGLLQSSKQYAANIARHEFYSPMRMDRDISLPQKYLAPWTGKLSSNELHHEDVIVQNALKYLRDKKRSAGPFACFISFHGPHPPYCSPPPYNDLYQFGDLPLPEILSPTWFGQPLTKSDWHHIKSQYYGAIAWIDNYIGQLLQLIDLNNTIVIFTSDHGDILGDHGYFSKGIFTFEGNIRVPLLVKAPHIGHSIYHHTVQMIDLLPTVLSLMGVPNNTHLDGLDLSRDLTTDKPVNQYSYSAISTLPRHYMIRSTRFKYNVGQTESFYDLLYDPQESNDLINRSDYTDHINQLRSDLILHLDQFNNEFANSIKLKITKSMNKTYFI